MKRSQSKKRLLLNAWLLFLAINGTSVSASTVTGGAIILNLDRDALAAAFPFDASPDRPAFYLEEYFDAQEAANRTNYQILNEHIVRGTGEISGLNREFATNGSVTSGQNIATNFSFSANDLEGTATGQIGLGGAMRFRADIDYSIDPVTGEETGNRVTAGYISLEYEPSRAVGNHSGWYLINHFDFYAELFDLDNVEETLTGNSLTLSGDLALAEAFNHLQGQRGALVGTFEFQTTVVPVPAAVWLFFSALFGIFGVEKFRTNRRPA